MKRGEKPEVSFPAPYIAPGVTDPRAAKYQRDLASRMETTPVAGGATPPIPLLSEKSREGMTMAEQAVAMQQAQRPTIFQAAPTSAPSMNPILPSDLLPEAATKDPQFQQGPGAMYAASQPHLARKYGVMRNTTHIPPQTLFGAPKSLSSKSLEDLQKFAELQAHQDKTVADLQTKAEKVSGEDARIEATAAQGGAGAAAKVGESPVAPGQVTDEERAKAREALSSMDDFAFDSLRQMMMRDLLNSEDQKKIVESRLQPLDITELIINSFVTQTVSIIPGKFEPEFQSVSGDDDLAIKRLIMEEAKSLDAPERYMLDKYGLMTLAAGVRSINRIPLPEYRDAEGFFDKALFLKKFNRLVRYPLHMLSSLGVHYFWFEIRVRKLFVAEKLGNG